MLHAPVHFGKNRLRLLPEGVVGFAVPRPHLVLQGVWLYWDGLAGVGSGDRTGPLPVVVVVVLGLLVLVGGGRGGVWRLEQALGDTDGGTGRGRWEGQRSREGVREGAGGRPRLGQGVQRP